MVKEVKTLLPAINGQCRLHPAGAGARARMHAHLGNFVSRMMFLKQMPSESEERAAFVVVEAVVTCSAARLGQQTRPTAGCRERGQDALAVDGVAGRWHRLVVEGGGDRLKSCCCRAQNSISSRTEVWCLSYISWGKAPCRLVE
jgi:hypothetical protein